MHNLQLTSPSLFIKNRNTYFDSTRTHSCIGVKQEKNSNSAIPFYKTSSNYFPSDKSIASTYLKSHSYKTFQPQNQMHVGAKKKTLEFYNPTSYRNRLLIEDPKVDNLRMSQVNFGNKAKGMYTTTYKAHFTGLKCKQRDETHQGINAYKVKWIHRKLKI